MSNRFRVDRALALVAILRASGQDINAQLSHPDKLQNGCCGDPECCGSGIHEGLTCDGEPMMSVKTSVSNNRLHALAMANKLFDLPATPVSLALTQRFIWAEDQRGQLWPGGPTAQEYVAGLVRHRGMGSYATKHGELLTMDTLTELLLELQWMKLPEGSHPAMKDKHEYYLGTLRPDSLFSLWENVALLGLLGDTDLDNVRVRRGPHGLELVHPRLEPHRVNTVTAICDKDGLVTWYPGQLTESVDLNKATVKCSAT